jgi:hypothetical protein
LDKETRFAFRWKQSRVKSFYSVCLSGKWNQELRYVKISGWISDIIDKFILTVNHNNEKKKKAYPFHEQASEWSMI